MIGPSEPRSRARYFFMSWGRLLRATVLRATDTGTGQIYGHVFCYQEHFSWYIGGHRPHTVTICRNTVA